jgi:hypothetical protein
MILYPQISQMGTDEEYYFIVIASEARQSRLPGRGTLDCFVAALLAMTELIAMTPL